ncbi:hypothetical protein N8940_00365 [Sphingomonadaceae bacterium]|nr:hypothetical protein [Sphingomonadaceae bacterium]
MCKRADVIDYFALALTHGLLLIAVIRMLGRDELDHEETGAAEEPETDTAPAGAATYRDGRPKETAR